MKKNKLLLALIVCSFTVIAANAADRIVVDSATSQVDVKESISGFSGANGGAINNVVGGHVTIMDQLEFHNNTSTSSWYGGGAIYNAGGIIDIRDGVSFDNNLIDASEGSSCGGAIANWDSGSLNIGKGVSFSKNGFNPTGKVAAVYGGAIFSDVDGLASSPVAAAITIDSGVDFKSNKASYGGAMFLEATNVTLKNGLADTNTNISFTDNHAVAGSGGAVYVCDYTGTGDSNGQQIKADLRSDVNFGVANFSENTATKDGGAISNVGSSLTVANNSTFSSNHADGNGGAISNVGSYANGKYDYYGYEYDADTEHAATLNLGNASFTENSAANGGAIYNTVSINEGLIDGTAVNPETNLYESLAQVTSSGEFKGNSATNNGGAIYNDGKLILNGASFSENKAKTGGAIYNTANGIANLEDVQFKAASNAAKNDIYNAGKIVAAGNNEFNSDINNVESASITFENGSKNIINGNLSGAGKISNNGEVVFGGANNTNFTGEYETGADSTTTVTGSFIGSDRTFSGGTLNWFTELDSKGKLTISDSTKLNIGHVATDETDVSYVGVLTLSEGESIANSVTTNIAENSTLNIKGGSAILNTGDTWSGDVVLSSGQLTVDGLGSNGDFVATGGELNFASGKLAVVNEGNVIAEAVKATINGELTINNGGVVTLKDINTADASKDSLGDNASIVLSKGGTLNYGISKTDASAVITADDGNLNLLEGANLTFATGSIDDKVVISIQKGANLKLDSSELNLDSEDKWNGNIINNGGVINANNLSKSSATATLTQSKGDLNLYNDSNLILGTESSITGGNISITKGDKGENGSVLTVYGDNEKKVIDGGNMTIDEYSKFVLGSGKFKLDTLSATAVKNEDGTVQAALVDVMNGEISESIIGEVILADSVEGKETINQANFNIDVYARSNQKKGNDTFKLNKIDSNATVYVNQWGLGGDLYGWDAPIDRHIQLKDIFLTEEGKPLLNNIEITKDTTFTPIGWYQLNKNEEYEDIIDEATGLPKYDADGMIMRNHIGSNYTLDLVKYNPQVFRGQVATVAQWMNQLNIDDMLFTHSMVLPSFKDADGGMMANRLAADSPLFAPYQYSRKDGGLWYKMYGTFENLQMNNGLSRVGNNAYGALIGADFGLKELKNGWKFMPTAYIGYNGAHQTFAHMGQYQNGGQAGFLGTWYKDNFIVGALAYGGIYDNSMDVRGFNDNTFNYFGGAATKAAYNIRFHRDWVLQPNLFVSYNYFGQQNWHSKFGQMGMMAGDLNGVNIAPGLNLIWEKETFSAYATLQYMYNINGACGGRAGNVGLPQVEMDRGYIQYGLGVNKKFTDRASGYLQAVLRNVGRTGVGFQAGFNYMIGK